MDSRELANMVEGMLRSQAWRAVEAELRELVDTAATAALTLGIEAHQAAELRGYHAGALEALDLPGRMLERLRQEGDA